MDIRFDNMKFLHERLFEGEVHLRMETVFQTFSDAQLTRLFRDHSPAGNGVVYQQEIELRRAMDVWLAEVSLLYLAWLSGYSGDAAATAYGERILKILGHASLRPYYERYYPVALPWLLRLHLEGSISIAAEAAPGAFEHFATLYEGFRNDEELSCFLDFLDGYCYGRGESAVRVETVSDAFANPDRVVEALFRARQQLTPLDKGIVGLLRFATFSTSLHELLQKCVGFPVLQSAFWFFYAFWYREFKKDVKHVSVGAIQKAALSTHDKGTQALASQSEQELDAILTALTDGRFANALIEKVPTETLGDLSFDALESTQAEEGWKSRFGAYRRD